MEVFTGDHGLPSDVVLFPDTHLTPFVLPTADTFSDQNKASTNSHHFPPPQPPQKLRPIRCNGRSFSVCCSDDPLDPKPPSWAPEVGFCNTETEGGSFIPPKPCTLGLSSKECQFDSALSSSSDESIKLQDAIKEPVSRKRKRKSRKKLELFIESMMRTVMEKQEEMHRQLLEVLEKKESESIMREAAWKQQEIERAKRDEQARAQEVSRSLALISFIQNSLGQEIQVPKHLDTSNLDKQGEHQNDQEVIMCDPSGNVDESESDPTVKRWPKSEVQALITVRAALNQKFNGKGPKGSVWEEVAARLSSMGYSRTPKKCKEKWENINKYYRRTMEKGKESGGKSQVCTYFCELEMLYKNGFISGNPHEEDQSMKG